MFAVQTVPLNQLNSWLEPFLTSYSDWGVAVGVGIFACCMFATLLGIIIRSI